MVFSDIFLQWHDDDSVSAVRDMQQNGQSGGGGRGIAEGYMATAGGWEVRCRLYGPLLCRRVMCYLRCCARAAVLCW